MRFSYRTIIGLLFFLLPFLAQAVSEDNPWSHAPAGMKDRYYEASGRFDEPWVLDFADSLDALSESSGERLFRMYADELRCHHAFNEGDSLNFIKFNESTRALAMKIGQQSVYFAEMTNLVSFYMNRNDNRSAQAAAQDMIHDGLEMDDPYGLFYGYYALGHLYSGKGALTRSTESFLKSIEYLDRMTGPTEANRAQVYSAIAFNYLDAGDYEKAQEYGRMSIVTSPTDDDVLACMALSSFELGDYEGFKKYRAEFVEKTDNTSISLEYYATMMDCYALALDHKYDDALELSETFAETGEVYSIRAAIYRLMGNWEKASVSLREAYLDQMSRNEDLFSEEIDQLSDELAAVNKVMEQEAKVMRQRVMLTIITAVTLAIIGLVLMLYFRSRVKMREQKRYLHEALQYQRLVDNLPFSYSKARLIFDEKGKVQDYVTISANHTLRKAFEKNNVAMGAMTVLQAYPESAPRIIGLINYAREHELPYIRCTYDLVEYGQTYEVVMLFDETDIIQTFSINTSEIEKARKELEAKNIELNAAVEKAVKADSFKTQFIKNMSHEIRTPMNAIMGFSQLLSMPDGFNTEEEKAQYASYIQSNSNMLLMLIDDILDLGDAENGSYRIELQDVRANDICRQAINSVEFRCPSAVRMYFTTGVDDDFMLHTDPRRVQQVLINYLTNACKHTNRGEIRVDVSLEENPGCVTFSVADTGTGVPPELAENIFERFMKVDSFKQGAGLGLNVCSTVASKLDGRVYLDTSYTSGARFVFVLPLPKA